MLFHNRFVIIRVPHPWGTDSVRGGWSSPPFRPAACLCPSSHIPILFLPQVSVVNGSPSGFWVQVRKSRGSPTAAGCRHCPTPLSSVIPLPAPSAPWQCFHSTPLVSVKMPKGDLWMSYWLSVGSLLNSQVATTKRKESVAVRAIGVFYNCSLVSVIY